MTRDPEYGYLRVSLILSCAVDDTEMTAELLRTYVALGTYASRRNDHWCWPKQSTIAARLGLTRQTINEHLNRLAELGYIEKRAAFRKDGGQSANYYRLVLDFVLPACRDRSQAAPGAPDTPLSAQADTPLSALDPTPPVGRSRHPLSAEADTPYIRTECGDVNTVSEDGRARKRARPSTLVQQKEGEAEPAGPAGPPPPAPPPPADIGNTASQRTPLAPQAAVDPVARWAASPAGTAYLNAAGMSLLMIRYPDRRQRAAIEQYYRVAGAPEGVPHG